MRGALLPPERVEEGKRVEEGRDASALERAELLFLGVKAVEPDRSVRPSSSPSYSSSARSPTRVSAAVCAPPHDTHTTVVPRASTLTGSGSLRGWPWPAWGGVRVGSYEVWR